MRITSLKSKVIKKLRCRISSLFRGTVLITTVIPTYVRENIDLANFERALVSISKQSFKSELILVSDDTESSELAKNSCYC